MVLQTSKKKSWYYFTGNFVSKKKDLVNHPPHYNQGDIECIDAIEAMLSPEEFIGYLRGNSFKYRWRFRYKNGLEDINKSEWYEKKLKGNLQGE